MVNIATTPIQCFAKEPSPAQKRFNTLTKGLQRDKALLQKWMEADSQLKMDVVQKIIPLAQEIDSMKLEMLVVLDKCYSNNALTIKQKKSCIRSSNTLLIHAYTLMSQELPKKYTTVITIYLLLKLTKQQKLRSNAG